MSTNDVRKEILADGEEPPDVKPPNGGNGSGENGNGTPSFGWRVSREIPVSLLVFLVVQTAGVGAYILTRDTQQDTQIAVLDKEVARLRSDAMMRAEALIETQNTHEKLAEFARQLDRIEHALELRELADQRDRETRSTPR